MPDTKSRLVLFVAFPGVGLLDLTGPQTVFWAASKCMQECGMPGYELHTVSLHGGLVHSMEGVCLDTRCCGDFAFRSIDTIVLPAAAICSTCVEWTAMVEWVRQAAHGARRTNSLCGMTDGIEIALAMIEADCGRGVAMKVARELVVCSQQPTGGSWGQTRREWAS